MQNMLSNIKEIKGFAIKSWLDDKLPPLFQLLWMKKASTLQMCNQSCICLLSSLSAYISFASEQGDGEWGRMGDRRAEAGTRGVFAPC